MAFSITQLFFDNRHYFKLAENAINAGIKSPIIPGIMPITNYNQIQKFATMCKATIPDALEQKLKKFENQPEDLVKAGIEYAVNMCEELIKNKTPGLHFFTLNKSGATLSIYDAIKGKLA